MAQTHISLCVFSLSLLFSPLTIHARHTKLFTIADVPSPSPAPVEPESDNGYGLYGRGRDSTQNEATNTNTIRENGTPSEGFGGDPYPNYNTGYTNTNNERLSGESLMSNNNDANGYTTEWYQPEKQRSDDDNYSGGYETEEKDGSSNGYNYYGNNFKYEFESMEEYDKYQKTKGGYWP